MSMLSMSQRGELRISPSRMSFASSSYLRFGELGVGETEKELLVESSEKKLEEWRAE